MMRAGEGTGPGLLHLVSEGDAAAGAGRRERAALSGCDSWRAMPIARQMSRTKLSDAGAQAATWVKDWSAGKDPRKDETGRRNSVRSRAAGQGLRESSLPRRDTRHESFGFSPVQGVGIKAHRLKCSFDLQADEPVQAGPGDDCVMHHLRVVAGPCAAG